MPAGLDMMNGLVSRVATPVASTDAANKAYADGAAGGGIQKGSGTLVAGALAVASATITPTSHIIVQRLNAPGGVALGAALNVRSVTPGAPGAFVIEALDEATGLPVATDTSDVQWTIIG